MIAATQLLTYYCWFSAGCPYFSARALQLSKKEPIIVFEKLKRQYLRKSLLILFILVCSTFISSAQQGRPSTGVQASIVRFYPNPATSVITFDFQKEYEPGFSIQIFNAILGRKVYDKSNVPDRTTINLSDYSRGIYIYQLRDKSGRMIESGKFQVAK